MQPQKPPRGLALDLAIKIGQTIERENRKRNGRVNVSHILRALEWTRYKITETVVSHIGDVPAD